MVVIKKKNSKIVAIFNRYKDILNNFIDSLSPKFLDWPKLFDQRVMQYVEI